MSNSSIHSPPLHSAHLRSHTHPYLPTSPFTNMNRTSSSSSSSPATVVQSTSSPTATPVTHRRSRSRELWNTLGFGGVKGTGRDVDDDEVMPIEHAEDSILLTPPPSLPKCSLMAVFKCSETGNFIPPAFYPGQSIPTILTFSLDRHSSLPHSLNPTLTMSLVGTLHIPNTPSRTIICVSVSLAEGLELWSRDAQQAYANRPPKDVLVDVKTCLPGGTYSLPLTVQVPSTPKLPPTFKVEDASFAVTYALTVTLTCDDPVRPGGRVVLSEAAKAFEMMPETMPTRAPRYTPTSFYVRSDGVAPGAVGTAKDVVRRENNRWTAVPHLPTTTFSPTSQIPLKLTITPPPEGDPQAYQILVRVALIRREHSSASPVDLRDPSGRTGLVKEEIMLAHYGWVECVSGDSKAIEVDMIMSLMKKYGWVGGYSTMLNVGAPAGSNGSTSQGLEPISVSSTFHLSASLVFFPTTSTNQSNISQMSSHPVPPINTFVPTPSDSPLSTVIDLKKVVKGATIRSLPIPIVIGSVSEPRGAMHNVRWSDLHLSRRNGTGEEVGRMINGEGVSCEDGWILAPPSYESAVKEVPYVYAYEQGGQGTMGCSHC